MKIKSSFTQIHCTYRLCLFLRHLVYFIQVHMDFIQMPMDFIWLRHLFFFIFIQIFCGSFILLDTEFMSIEFSYRNRVQSNFQPIEGHCTTLAIEFALINLPSLKIFDLASLHIIWSECYNETM